MGAWEHGDGILPWTRTCFVCGVENPAGLHLRSRVVGDRVVLTHVARDSDLGYRHLVHGGITMTLLDEVMTWAAILTRKESCVAAELTVRLRRPVSVGQELRVEGWVTSAKPRLILAEGQALDGAGEVLATATGKYVAMPGDGHSLCVKDFVESSEVLQLPFLKT